jgi:hypothetical protein
MLAVPVTPKLDDRMVAPPTVSAPDKLSAEPVTEDERITAELNVAVPVTFTPESISAVVTTIFAEVRVSPEDPSMKTPQRIIYVRRSHSLPDVNTVYIGIVSRSR